MGQSADLLSLFDDEPTQPRPAEAALTPQAIAPNPRPEPAAKATEGPTEPAARQGSLF